MTLFRWYNFGGGLQRTSNDYLRQDDQTKVSVNVTYATTGSITKRNGYTKLGVVFTTTSTSTTTTSTSTSISTSTTSTSTTSTSTTWTDSTTSTSSTTTSTSTSTSSSTTSTSISSSSSTTSTSISTTSTSTTSTSTTTTSTSTTSTSTSTTTNTTTSTSSSTTTIGASCTIDQQNTTVESYSNSFGRNDARKIAQSFIPSRNGAICHLYLSIFRSGSPTDNVRVSIYSDSAGAPGSELDTADNTASGSGISTTFSYLDFPFTGGYSLVAGTTYWILIERTGSYSDSNSYGARITRSNNYTSGSTSTTNSSNVWVSSGINYDLYFKQYSIV